MAYRNQRRLNDSSLLVLASGPGVRKLKRDALQHVRRQRLQQHAEAYVDVTPNKPQILQVRLPQQQEQRISLQKNPRTQKI